MHEIRWNVTRSYLPNDFHSFTPNDCNDSIEQKKTNSNNNNGWKKNSIFDAQTREYLLLIFFGDEIEHLNECKSVSLRLNSTTYTAQSSMCVLCVFVVRIFACLLGLLFAFDIFEPTHTHIWQWQINITYTFRRLHVRFVVVWITNPRARAKSAKGAK